ncbi:MAG: hypothetical protein ACQETB_08650 [Halobacteriota archaeon]
MDLIASTTPLLIDTLRSWAYFVAIYGITIAASAWVFRDARRRGISLVRAGLWGIFGVLVPAVTHLLYLYLRRKREGSFTG